MPKQVVLLLALCCFLVFFVCCLAPVSASQKARGHDNKNHHRHHQHHQNDEHRSDERNNHHGQGSEQHPPQKSDDFAIDDKTFYPDPEQTNDEITIGDDIILQPEEKEEKGHHAKNDDDDDDEKGHHHSKHHDDDDDDDKKGHHHSKHHNDDDDDDDSGQKIKAARALEALKNNCSMFFQGDKAIEATRRHRPSYMSHPFQCVKSCHWLEKNYKKLQNCKHHGHNNNETIRFVPAQCYDNVWSCPENLVPEFQCKSRGGCHYPRPPHSICMEGHWNRVQWYNHLPLWLITLGIVLGVSFVLIILSLFFYRYVIRGSHAAYPPSKEHKLIPTNDLRDFQDEEGGDKSLLLVRE